jgi:hypothetical protein
MAARERNPDAVRRLLAANEQRRPLGRSQSGDTLREVLRLGRSHVLKRYTMPLDARRHRRPWLREHEALECLAGWHAPRTVGYAEETDGQRRIVCYVREYVPARPIVAVDLAALGEMATLLAGYHRRAVVTDDALLQNFMRTRDGSLIVVDMGRARLFRPRSPLLPLGIALELTKFRRASLGGDDALFSAFITTYFEASHLGTAGRAVVWILMRLLIWQRRIRNGQRS